ncbi:MAG: cls [Thermoleophilia bacterium]|nr:cls [Thermoleophilia bacterium]
MTPIAPIPHLPAAATSAPAPMPTAGPATTPVPSGPKGPGATMPMGAALDDAQVAALATKPDSILPMLAPVGGSTVRLLTDEGEVLPEMLASVRGAQKQVDLTMFSLADSGAGKEMVDSLIDRAQKGVGVRVTVDQVGSAVLPKVGAGTAMLDRMREAGVQVEVNDRVSQGGLQAVDHRKLLVVDGTTAYTGGMNLSKKFGKWHDVMVRIDGPAAARFGAHFVDRWVDMGGAVKPGSVIPVGTPTRGSHGAAQAEQGVSLLANYPGKDLHASTHLLENIAKASTRAWILTPTLSDPEVVAALKEAAGRGVDTRVAVSGPEGWIGTRALGLIGSTFYRELVGAGVKVYEQPGMSHAKVSLVDDIASVGSLNMTRRAMLWDHELMLASDHKPFVGQIENLFTTDFAKSNAVTPERANAMGARVGELVRRGTGLKW